MNFEPRCRHSTVDQLERLAVKLQEKFIGRAHSLKVTLEEDGLVLEGFSITYHVKQLVQHAVQMETTLPIRRNAITVVGPRGRVLFPKDNELDDPDAGCENECVDWTFLSLNPQARLSSAFGGKQP